MSNQFLKEIHQFVTDKIADSTAAMEKAKTGHGNNDQILKYHEGKLTELSMLRALMDNKYNLTTQSYH
jgi:hypothetical protein